MTTDYHLPFHEKASWDEANGSISYLLNKRPQATGDLQRAAQDLRALFQESFPILDRLCAATCPFCPDPCCLKATIWFDLKDMVFLHLIHGPIPEAQPLFRQGETCRYSGPKGCALPRHTRPFICTLYLCPPQRSILRRCKEEDKRFMDMIQMIKMKRNALEEAFVRITSASC